MWESSERNAMREIHWNVNHDKKVWKFSASVNRFLSCTNQSMTEFWFLSTTCFLTFTEIEANSLILFAVYKHQTWKDLTNVNKRIFYVWQLVWLMTFRSSLISSLLLVRDQSVTKLIFVIKRAVVQEPQSWVINGLFTFWSFAIIYMRVLSLLWERQRKREGKTKRLKSSYEALYVRQTKPFMRLSKLRAICLRVINYNVDVGRSLESDSKIMHGE
jgi:hypothetical protein